jgi:putative addiction module component (TIGR02574 family)
MSADVPEILAAAMSLPDGDRASIAYQLLGTLKPPSILSDDDDQVGEELERRIGNYESGTTHASDWHDVDARLRQALDDRRRRP